jgi:aryl sulfotransferase
MALSKHDIHDVLPRKKRDVHNYAMDSTRWNDFRFRDGDIVIGTWSKSGTTWMQQIVTQLIFDGRAGIPIADIAPWVDMRILPLEEMMAQLEAQSHRRCLKTHLPADALIFSPKAKYIYVGRDGRDVVWSWYNHLRRMSPALYDAFNTTPGLVGAPLERPPNDVRAFFHDWLDNDGAPVGSFWQNVQSWWDVRHSPNVLLVHFSELKADMPMEIRRIAEFLEIGISEDSWPAILEHCSFDYMKLNADTLSDHFKHAFDGGLQTFIYKGTNSRWRDALSPGEIEKYEAHAKANLSPECAHWLATGQIVESA